MDEERIELERLLDIPVRENRIVLNCLETLKEVYGDYKYSTPSKEEIQKLKPIVDFRLNVDNRRIRRFYIVAGGYAAYVAGRTFDYDDIDIFTNSPNFGRYREHQYNPRFHIVDKPPYQYIHTNFPGVNSIGHYIEDILGGFDLDICSVAYTFFNNAYMKVERIRPLNKHTILKIKPDRFFKYAKRAKNVNSLKHLSLFTFLKHGKENERKYFNNVIVPRFDFS